RLLAIVNRLDLRSTGNAGEGRFIFGVVDSLGQPLAFTVILEYGVPLARVGSVQAWASRWHKLAALPLGSPAYNQALQDITDTFSAAGANPAKPNGSALNQLRTNELAIGSSWELREFQISRQSGLLAQVTVKQTPKQALNNSKELASFLKANAAAVLAGRHVVPPAMLAAGNQATFDWQAPGVDEKVRKAFAVATCNGCHTTDAFFLHVGTRQRGQAAPLSDFVTRTELPARARDLAKLLR
ncbi:MAG: LamG domain-containing protein, partial [Candidatus Sericytochromatia bacterium]|nr:LamG domain-containing protein [Candidatus Sericytochromatia bacterium]